VSIREMCKRRLKEQPPSKTLSRIQRILADFPLDLKEQWHPPVLDSFYSLKLLIPGTGLSVNGKGVTESLARVSAYAEFMERLQNHYLYRAESRRERHGVTLNRPPDETHIPWDQVALSSHSGLAAIEAHLAAAAVRQIADAGERYSLRVAELIGNGGSRLALLEQYCGANAGEATVPAVPFCNVTRGNIEHIPRRALSLYGSNGMCAGNSPEEALAQGLCEIFERRAVISCVSDSKAAPTFTRRALQRYKRLWRAIRRLESHSDYRVIVKDCSLGQRYPVVATIMINRSNQSYSVNFGSHPSFEVALERTLTEKFQLRGPEELDVLNYFSIRSPALANPHNVSNLLKAGVGAFPADFLVEPETPASPRFPRLKGRTNAEVVKSLLQLLEDAGHEVLIRDVSFLGFPAFHIVVPGFSEMYPDPLNRLEITAARARISSIMQNLEAATETDLDALLAFLEHARLSIGENSIDFLYNLPLDERAFEGRPAPFDFLASVVWYKRGDLARSLRFLSFVIQCASAAPERFPSLPRYRCLAEYLSMKLAGKSEARICAVLKAFFRDDVVGWVLDTFGDPSRAVGLLYPAVSCFECGACKLRNVCCYAKIEPALIWVAGKSEESGIPQEPLLKWSNARLAHSPRKKGGSA
jgi:ribosomal protein S12 methylthiotransferase accessory factor